MPAISFKRVGIFEPWDANAVYRSSLSKDGFARLDRHLCKNARLTAVFFFILPVSLWLSACSERWISCLGQFNHVSVTISSQWHCQCLKYCSQKMISLQYFHTWWHHWSAWLKSSFLSILQIWICLSFFVANLNFARLFARLKTVFLQQQKNFKIIETPSCKYRILLS